MAEVYEKQQHLLRTVSRALENFKKIGRDNLTPAKVRSRLTQLKDAWAAVEAGHITLLRMASEEEKTTLAYFKDNLYEICENIYQTTYDYMAEWLEQLEPTVSSFQHINSRRPSVGNPSPFSIAHLPPINLPPFDGKHEEWESFRDRFKSLIIDNSDLSEFSRMHFLTSCLKGSALECIKTIPITANNFQVAWDTLISRFENKRRLINVHLSTLLTLPAVSRESAVELQMIREKMNTAVTALRNLNRTSAELWDDILVCLASRQLDAATRKAWNLKFSDADDPPTYADFCKFIDSRIRALEECQLPSSSSHKPGTPSRSTRISCAAASAKQPTPCPLCKAKHYFSSCPRFQSESPSQRRELVKQHNRCFNCLSKTHSSRSCESKYTCRLCQQKHHTMLHVDSDSSMKNLEVAPAGSRPQPNSAETRIDKVSSLLVSSNSKPRSRVLLATAWVSVGASCGRSVVVRALLDQGSEMTFMSERLAQCLRIKRIRMPISVSAVGGVDAGTYHHAAHITITPRNVLAPAFSTTALILKTLTTYSPRRVHCDTALNHLADLHWADPDPTSAESIDVIIGADVYSYVLLDGLRKGAVGQPVAQNSVFGWILSGPLSHPACFSHAATAAPSRDHSSVAGAVHCLHVSSLEQQISRFWEIEEIPQPATLSPQDEKCEEHFLATHSRCPDGRYMVRLPFKQGPPIDIGRSRVFAERSLNRLLQCFQRHSSVEKEYAQFLHDYESLGHMREIPAAASSDSQVVFIPHHPVLRDRSATTRLRVVFNASCVTTNGSSLNDHLLTGPKLQTDLSAVLLRWRQYKYVYTADIAKMYRQIRVDPRDVPYQQILWKRSASACVREFQLLTVTYGTASAPYQALRVLQQLSRDEGQDLPKAVKILRENCYVDDVLFGASQIDRVLDKRAQITTLLQRGGFELRKWASNTPDLLSGIDTENHGLALPKSLQSDESLKILGIRWNPASDCFQFELALPPTPPRSKRLILSVIAKLFDPLGWITPVTGTAKIFMQQLWRLQLNWDDQLPPAQLVKWQEILTQFAVLSRLQLPRWTGLGPNIARCEIHGFSDASNAAYAAVVYLKVTSLSGDVTLSLLAGKSKVAPLKPMSVPRLELSAALLLARLITFIRKSFSIPSDACYCWTDSTIVLTWVSQHPSKWKTFVSHRVTEIQSCLPQIPWRHVPTADNPADCASRGLYGKDLLDHTLWWEGPSWLAQSSEHWPLNISPVPSDTVVEERPVSVLVACPQAHWDLAERFSSWPRLLRVTAYLIRFGSRCRRRRIGPAPLPSSAAITARECHAARIFWLKFIQSELFIPEMTALINQRPLASKSRLLPLNPFLDQDGLIRVGGRLKNAPIPAAQKYPVILASHPLVDLIIRQAHSRVLHGGIQLTLLTLRRDFWILRGRSLVRSVIHKCVICTREQAAVPQQLMGDLPALRVSPPSRSFQHCGLDYAGPVPVRPSGGRGIKSRKAYIALFVCLATRAIHLELVGDYSTSAFLAAFSRFCARRGLPESIYSDNGTTFVGADKELSLAYNAARTDPSFLNSTASDGIAWHFLPPSAPHFGGLWEAGVRSLKHHLRRVLKDNTLTFEEFTTLLCRIEACLNSRPLTPLKDTLDDFEVLTPGHFLIGTSLTDHPEPSLLQLHENRLSRWQRVRQITERFWRLWQCDYVNTLQQRSKWQNRQPAIEVGQMVLIRNNTLPPCKWELGRVTQCHPGSDGLVRVVTVKTAKSEYKRPIVKVSLLPVDLETSST